MAPLARLDEVRQPWYLRHVWGMLPPANIWQHGCQKCIYSVLDVGEDNAFTFYLVFLGNIQSGSLCFPEDCKSGTCPSELHDPFLRYPCELMWRQLTEAMAHHWPMPQKVSILRFASCCLKMAGASRRNWNKESLQNFAAVLVNVSSKVLISKPLTVVQGALIAKSLQPYGLLWLTMEDKIYKNRKTKMTKSQD